MTPSIATKFQYINSLLFSFLTHYMFRPLLAIFRWDIQLDIWRTILIQRIRCTYAIWCRDVICCTSVFRLVVLIHVIKLNIKIKNCKISKILLILNSGPWTKSSNSVILSVIHHHQNPLDSTRSTLLLLRLHRIDEILTEFSRHAHRAFRGYPLNIMKTNLRGLKPQRIIPTERPPFVGEDSANFLRIEGATWSVTDPYGHILGFLDRSRSSIVLTRQIWPRSRPTTPKMGSAGNRTRTSGSVARNSDH
jgi:hypothetical protein